MVKNKYKNNSSESRGFQGIIKKLGQLRCYCLIFRRFRDLIRTFELNLEGTFTRKCKIKLIYFVFCSFIRTFVRFKKIVKTRQRA